MAWFVSWYDAETDIAPVHVYRVSDIASIFIHASPFHRQLHKTPGNNLAAVPGPSNHPCLLGHECKSGPIQLRAIYMRPVLAGISVNIGGWLVFKRHILALGNRMA